VLWFCSIAGGLCFAGMVYCGSGAYSEFVEFVHGDLDDRLRSLRAQTPKLRRWIHIWLGIVAAVFLSLTFVMDGMVTAFVVAMLLSAGPWYIVRRISEARRLKIEDQLADAMVMFSSAVRAGLSLPQCLEMLAMECPKPIKQEFGQIIGEYKLGKPLERTLNEAKDRLRSENFVLFAAALLASRESGGKLNETVDRISKSVMEVQRLERKVMSETAQARKSALYMALAPPFILVAYYFMDPQATQLLFNTISGQIILSVALILNVVAYFWALRILNPDI